MTYDDEQDLQLRLESIERAGATLLVAQQYLPSSVYKKIRTENSDMKDFLDHLKQELTDRLNIEVTLAYYPSARLVTFIQYWAQEHSKVPATVHIKVDRSIVGGAVVGMSGKVYNQSLLASLPSHE